jgi:hypothetical protein
MKGCGNGVRVKTAQDFSRAIIRSVINDDNLFFNGNRIDHLDDLPDGGMFVVHGNND